MTANPLIELRNITKRFGGVVALDDVSMSIGAGEIHCLAGENGSGKSTIIKVMSGVYQPDEGQILIDGKPAGRLSPVQSVRHGVQVIYQDFSLFGNLTVAENLVLNTYLRDGRRLMDRTRARVLAQQVLDRLNVSLDLDRLVETLPTSGKQIVAIARAVMADARLLIMDEPTTALTRHEVDGLFRIVRELQAQGIAILFVSHKMREMLEISERLTVFRNGAKVDEGPIGNFDEPAITRAMTGREIETVRYEWVPDDPSAPPRLEVRNLTIPGEVEDVSLTLRAGEVVGLSGLIGSGRTELALALFGMKQGHGTIRIDGRDLNPKNVHDAIGGGVAYVPEDRLSEGLFLPQSILRNSITAAIGRFCRGPFLNRRAARAETQQMFEAMQVKAPGLDFPVSNLSGGNQQRVVIGRWLMTGARVLILNGPTVGVDVGSKEQIHRIIHDLARKQGLAVLMLSDDVPELAHNCNRVLMMHRGRLLDELRGPDLTEDAINDRLKQLD